MYVLPPLIRMPLVTLSVLLAIIFFCSRLIRQWTSHGHSWTAMQQFSLTAGILTCMSILGGLQEINPARSPRPLGMSLVGTGCILFLIWMHTRVRRLGMVVLAPQQMAMAAGTDAFGPVSSYEVLALPVAELDEPQAPPLANSVDVPLLVRAFEIAVASSVLLSTSPIMLLLAIMIRRGTPGKALFYQRRLGKDCNPFTFVKFRTLYSDARQRFPELYAYQYTPTALASLKFKIVSDPRVTRQGEWMRKSTLDELPNFWNVLTGEMALVGPRPEIPEMLQYYTPEMRLKFSVRPGITGLAQISGRGRLSFYDTARLDIEYVQKRSLALDAKILALTIYKMTTRDGAF
jgi:lipopolysaccharide/colanic/teichoic acid biosynthesis glycosyltransferase